MERTFPGLTVANVGPSFDGQLESCFEAFESHPIEFENAAGRGAFKLQADWIRFVAKDEQDQKLLIESPAGNLAALCFPLVRWSDQMESFAYVLEYCLRQNAVPQEAHKAMQMTIGALARGQYCGQDTGRITHTRGLFRIQLIVADKVMLTRPMHHREATFFEKDQTHALANLSPGAPVRPDRILRAVLRLFRVNLAMPNSQAYQEAWDLVVQSMTLTADALVARNLTADTSPQHKTNTPLFTKIKQKLHIRLAEKQTVAVVNPIGLKETNAKFIAAKTKLQKADASIERGSSLLAKWEALVKGHCIWGLQSDVYRAWEDRSENMPNAGLLRGLSRSERRRSLLSSLHSPSLSTNSDAKSLRRVTGDGRKLLEDEF